MNESVTGSVFTILDKLGITNYVIPFLLIWTALYAVLMKLKLVSENAQLNGLIAFAIAYIVVAFGIGPMINALLPLFIMFALLLIVIILLFSFIGVPGESIASAFKNPGVILIVVGFVVLLTFVALQDWLIFSDRIPAWKVNESGAVLEGVSHYPDNETAQKPPKIIVNGVEYTLIKGMYYKQGYEGTAYAIGNPQVIASIFILAILGVATALIVWPKD